MLMVDPQNCLIAFAYYVQCLDLVRDMCEEGCVLFEEVRRFLDAGRYSYIGCVQDSIDVRRLVSNITVLFPEEEETLCLQARSWQDGLPVSLIEPHPSPVGTVWDMVHAYPERLYLYAHVFASMPKGFIIQDSDREHGFLPPSLASEEATPEPRDVSRRRATPFPSRVRGTSEIPEPSTSVREVSVDPRLACTDCPDCRASEREAWLRSELDRQLGSDSPLSPIAEHGDATPTTNGWSPRSPSHTAESPVYSPRSPSSAELTADAVSFNFGDARLPSPLPSCHASAGPAFAHTAGHLVLAYENMTSRCREFAWDAYGEGRAAPRVRDSITADGEVAPDCWDGDFDDVSVPTESREEALVRIGRAQSLPPRF